MWGAVEIAQAQTKGAGKLGLQVEPPELLSKGVSQIGGCGSAEPSPGGNKRHLIVLAVLSQ